MLFEPWFDVNRLTTQALGSLEKEVAKKTDIEHHCYSKVHVSLHNGYDLCISISRTFKYEMKVQIYIFKKINNNLICPIIYIMRHIKSNSQNLYKNLFENK